MQEQDLQFLKRFHEEIDESHSSELRINQNGIRMKQNIHILMSYIGEQTSTQIVELFVWMLKNETMQNLDLYLPQLCYLVITKVQDDCVFKLKKFIVEISIEKPNIGLRALHYF